MEITVLENSVIDFALRHMRGHDQMLLNELQEPPVLLKYEDHIKRIQRRLKITDKLLLKLMNEESATYCPNFEPMPNPLDRNEKKE